MASASSDLPRTDGDILGTHQFNLGGLGTVALPGMLLAAMILTVVYRQIFHGSADALKQFIGLIALQMAPLVFLKFRIQSCPDPASLMGQFARKVVLMHVIFLILRCCSIPFNVVGSSWVNVLSLGVAIHVLVTAFDFKFDEMARHSDIIKLSITAFITGLVVEMMDMPKFALHTGCNFIEIVSFSPAVWMLQTTDTNFTPMEVDGDKATKQAKYFFTFLASFYLYEDIIQPMVSYNMLSVAPLICVGHIAHFVLLVDFANFFLKAQGQKRYLGTNSSLDEI